ncbi:MAG: TetR/AcrR family transcriptional regulator [Lachnospiraceae bacterium]
MNQEEKAQISKNRIIKAATLEFSIRNYDTASLNNICNESDISKGLIYHYFGNKEELYLSCVKACFKKITEFLSEEIYDFSDFQSGMKQYLARRFLFFRTHIQEGHLFLYAVLQPPQSLQQPILKLKEDFDAQCLFYYKTALSSVTLREGVTEQLALEYFVLFQELFNGYFQRYAGANLNAEALMKEHEAQLSNVLQLMLYGIAKEEKNDHVIV